MGITHWSSPAPDPATVPPEHLVFVSRCLQKLFSPKSPQPPWAVVLRELAAEAKMKVEKKSTATGEPALADAARAALADAAPGALANAAPGALADGSDAGAGNAAATGTAGDNEPKCRAGGAGPPRAPADLWHIGDKVVLDKGTRAPYKGLSGVVDRYTATEVHVKIISTCSLNGKIRRVLPTSLVKQSPPADAKAAAEVSAAAAAVTAPATAATEEAQAAVAAEAAQETAQVANILMGDVD